MRCLRFHHSHQVKKRLLQEQDDKDLLIILGDIPPLKVSCNFFQGVQESNSLWQEFEDLISATGEASLTGKAYLQGGRWIKMQLSKSLGDAQSTQPFFPKCYIHLFPNVLFFRLRKVSEKQIGKKYGLLPNPPRTQWSFSMMMRNRWGKLQENELRYV